MNSIADGATADIAVELATMPRFEDGCINLQELLRQLAESVVNEIMSAEADQLCEATGNSRNGYRKRKLMTCVGTLTLRIPKLRIGSFFPDDVLERYQRVDRAIVAAVAEMYATGTSVTANLRITTAVPCVDFLIDKYKGRAQRNEHGPARRPGHGARHQPRQLLPWAEPGRHGPAWLGVRRPAEVAPCRAGHRARRAERRRHDAGAARSAQGQGRDVRETGRQNDRATHPSAPETAHRHQAPPGLHFLLQTKPWGWRKLGSIEAARQAKRRPTCPRGRLSPCEIPAFCRTYSAWASSRAYG